MIKPIHLLISIALGFIIGLIVTTCNGEQEIPVDTQIHKLKEEIGWRGFKEELLRDSLKYERLEKIALAKDNIELKSKFQKAEAKYLEAKKTIPLTRSDTIKFLVRDTVLCDSALTKAKELITGLTKEIKKDSSIIKNQDSLNLSLQSDKKNLITIDSLNQQTEKQLIKQGKKKFLKGLGIGAAIAAILIAIL